MPPKAQSNETIIPNNNPALSVGVFDPRAPQSTITHLPIIGWVTDGRASRAITPIGDVDVNAAPTANRALLLHDSNQNKVLFFKGWISLKKIGEVLGGIGVEAWLAAMNAEGDIGEGEGEE